MTDPTELHECVFPELELTEADEDEEGNLKAGMRILVPCSCGETPHDHMEILDLEHRRAGEALLAADPRRALYHWSPRSRRKQIERYGLRPRMRQTTSTTDDEDPKWRPGVVCFADDPGWAWALSGAMPWTPLGEWDLWMTSLDRLDDPIVMASDERSSGIYEVRVVTRVYKRDLFWIASRVKPEPAGRG